MSKSQIFLSYAREDEEKVLALYGKLTEAGFKPWMDVEDILPGEKWEGSIGRAIEASEFVLICLSGNSVDKRGYLQREIGTALDLWEEKLEDDIYLIPVRLEKCQPPGRLCEFQWVDWFSPRGWNRLLKALHAGLERQGKTPPSVTPARKPETKPRSAVKKTTTPAVARSSPKSQRPDTPEPKGTSVLVAEPLPAVSDLLGHQMVYVPPGPFLMGSDPEADGDARSDEQPQYTVELPGYWIGRYPVTVGQYRTFVQESGHKPKGKDSLKGPDDYPVRWVTWHEALAYCRRLGERADDILPEGYAVSLPSEAEWEKAARGTEGRIYPWGNDPPTDKLCNFGREVGTTTPVGRYSPRGDSPFGCADMAGNVWEWTRSLFEKYPYDPADGRENLDADGRRVVRGGSFCYDVVVLRCACRYRDLPLLFFDCDGFRVVVVSPIFPSSAL